MTVADTTSIDQVAVNDEGRVILAMTEVRPYGGQDQAQLIEDFRLKLNAYLYAIRSGQLAGTIPQGTDPTEFGIELFAAGEPPPEIQEVIRIANDALAGERCTVSWRVMANSEDRTAKESVAPRDLSVDELPVALAKAVLAVLPPGWTHAKYRPAIILGRSQDELAVRLSDGSVTFPAVPAEAREFVPWLKHKMYEPGRGTWLSADFTMVADGALYAEYNYDDEPAWSRPVPDQCWADELETYPRDAERLPNWWSAKLSG